MATDKRASGRGSEGRRAGEAGVPETGQLGHRRAATPVPAEPRREQDGNGQRGDRPPQQDRKQPIAFALPGDKSARTKEQRPPPPQVRRTRAFGEDDDDADARIGGTLRVAPMSKATRRQQEEAEKIDAAAFDYDGVYDKMKRVERELRDAHKAENKERKSKYRDNFLAAAEVRERDRLRAETKMIQRQREMEGDEFEGKDAFVTSAYKEQQEQLARAEAEERVREERERQKSGGVASFYRDMLNEESELRQAAVHALDAEDSAAGASLASRDADGDLDAAQLTDRMRAEKAAQRGLRVELNEDQQIVDQRDLLSRGLNVFKKRKEPATPAPSAPASDRAQRSRLMEEELLARLGE
ncbi:hypothetical protein MSPP1_001068 [Malassezia sp. CBS 17886]|nr:hypothetical protein MSPP1_001068 [Malassezia sp. CBS 17886]